VLPHNARQLDPLDAIPVGDPPDLPLGSLVPDIIAWAEREIRFLDSFDRSSLPVCLATHLQAGHQSAGIFLIRRTSRFPKHCLPGPGRPSQRTMGMAQPLPVHSPLKRRHFAKLIERTEQTTFCQKAPCGCTAVIVDIDPARYVPFECTRRQSLVEYNVFHELMPMSTQGRCTDRPRLLIWTAW
jgi:hypothetical protein